MALTSWLCSNSSKNMVVKIKYPGGGVELHDRPILASEIMRRNPKCCVARPDVFREPSAVVPPDTVLMLGQKFYVVPISTLRRLRRHSLRKQSRSLQVPQNSPMISSSSPKKSEAELADAAGGGSSSKPSVSGIKGRQSRSDDRCLQLFRLVSEIKARKATTDDGTRCRGHGKQEDKGSPVSPTTLFYLWQPRLDSILEE